MEDEGGSDAPVGPMFGARVISMTGRGSDGSRGLPPAATITLQHDDGTTLAFDQYRPGLPTARVLVLAEPPTFTDFGFCPICGATEQFTREHVPQRDLGGTVMTMTCERCNNRLGSLVEDELRDWFDDAVGSVSWSGGDVPGRRRAPRVLLRRGPDGSYGLVPDKGNSDADIDRMFAGGQVQISYRQPDRRIWSVAALKHAYLGACIVLGEVPDSPLAAYVRGDLVKAREGRRGVAPPVSGIAKSLRIRRSYQPAQGATVLLVALVNDEGEVVDGGLSFAGTLFVSWPLEAELFHRARG